MTSMFPNEDDVTQVCLLCPDISREDVKRDLFITGNVETTINRIFDGLLVTASRLGGGSSSTEVNSDSELELPLANIRREVDVKSSHCEIDRVFNLDSKFQVFSTKSLCSSANTACTTSEHSSTDVNTDSDIELPPLDINTIKTLDRDYKGCGNTPVLIRDAEQDKNSDDELPPMIFNSTQNVSDLGKDGNQGVISLDSDEEHINAAILKIPERIVNQSCKLKRKHSRNMNFRREVNRRDFISEDADIENDDIITFNADVVDLSRNSDSENDQIYLNYGGDSKLQSLPLNSVVHINRTTSDYIESSLFDRISGVNRLVNTTNVTSSTETANFYVPKKHNSVCSISSDIQKTETSSCGFESPTKGILDSTDSKVTKKKRRTPEEIAESKHQAEVKKVEREKLRQKKEYEAKCRKAEVASKKHLKPKECIQHISIIVDPTVVNGGLGASILSAAEGLGVKCVTEPQPIPNTVTWRRQVTECSYQDLTVTTVDRAVTENDILLMIPVSEFVDMVHCYKESQRGIHEGGVTLREHVQIIKATFPGCTLTIVIHGLEKYFRDQKTQKNREHKDAVSTTNFSTEEPKKKRAKKITAMTIVSRLDVEETLVDLQLQTNTCSRAVENVTDVGDIIRTFTKAVAEKPLKKGRLQSAFSFHGESVGGVKVDRNGVGLLKVWKIHLQQFKNIGADTADAIVAVYRSPKCLLQAYENCSSERECERLLENILVRRGAGVLETSRRVGKEFSRRMYYLLTTRDPQMLLK